MKTLKRISAVLFLVSLFAVSSCNIMEEPDFNTEVGKNRTEDPVGEE